MANKFNDLDPNLIVEAVKKSQRLSETLHSLGYIDNGYNRSKIKETILSLGIDTSHYKTVLSKKDYEKNPKQCKFCGKVLPWSKRDNVFCDHSCAASYNRRGRTSRVSLYCLNCGKKLTKKSKRSHFCNNTCYSEYNRKSYIERWKRGEETGMSGSCSISRILRDYLINESNQSCQVCGWGEVNPHTKKIPLQIHHIDGDCTNNSPENLQVLCPNCHSLTHNYGSRNKNSTRKDKRCKKHQSIPGDTEIIDSSDKI